MQKVEFDVEEQNLSQRAYENILNELINDLIAQFCYTLHRSLKLDSLFIDLNKNDNETEDIDSRIEAESQAKGKLKVSIINCPRCNVKVDATRFAPHLEKCMGLGRTSSRNASKRLLSNAYNDCDDYDNESDGASSKRVTKKKPQKKPSGNAQKLKHRDQFFKTNCGVKSRYTNKSCMKTLNCKQHSEKEKDNVRNLYKKEFAENVGEDIQIDVDTVEINNQYTEMDLSRSPTSSENSPLSNNLSWKSSSTSNIGSGDKNLDQGLVRYSRN